MTWPTRSARGAARSTALPAFGAAARFGSCVRVADELAEIPTAISPRIKGLEETLGVGLFVRLRRGLRLTNAGAAYLPGLTRGFDALARLVVG